MQWEKSSIAPKLYARQFIPINCFVCFTNQWLSTLNKNPSIKMILICMPKHFYAAFYDNNSACTPKKSSGYTNLKCCFQIDTKHKNKLKWSNRLFIPRFETRDVWVQARRFHWSSYTLLLKTKWREMFLYRSQHPGVDQSNYTLHRVNMRFHSLRM